MIRNDNSKCEQTDKKTYVSPQLIKHGKVEALTQGPTTGISCPIGHSS